MNIQKAKNVLSDVNDRNRHFPEFDKEYALHYSALCELARIIKDSPDHKGILQLGLAAYGWMPRILRGWRPDSLKNIDNPIVLLRGIECWDQAREALLLLKGPLFNNSWIGTSKVLHLLNPEYFPIWDSNVAFQFDLYDWLSQNNDGVYLCYFDFIRCVINQDNLANLAAEKKKRDNASPPVTDTRFIELILFETGRRDRVEARSRTRSKASRKQLD